MISGLIELLTTLLSSTLKLTTETLLVVLKFLKSIPDMLGLVLLFSSPMRMAMVGAGIAVLFVAYQYYMKNGLPKSLKDLMGTEQFTDPKTVAKLDYVDDRHRVKYDARASPVQKKDVMKSTRKWQEVAADVDTEMEEKIASLH